MRPREACLVAHKQRPEMGPDIESDWERDAFSRERTTRNVQVEVREYLPKVQIELPDHRQGRVHEDGFLQVVSAPCRLCPVACIDDDTHIQMHPARKCQRPLAALRA